MTSDNVTAADLRNALQTGIISFSFVKKDGSLRAARGTTLLNKIPVNQHPKGNPSSPLVVPFYDLEAEGWRSVSIRSSIFI